MPKPRKKCEDEDDEGVEEDENGATSTDGEEHTSARQERSASIS